jgi:hypothetical protein
MTTISETELLKAERRLAQRRAALGIAPPSPPLPTTPLHKEATDENAAKKAHESPEIPAVSSAGSSGKASGKAWWVEGLGDGEAPESSAAIPLWEYIEMAADRNRSSFEKACEDGEKVSGDPQHYRSPCTVFIAFLKNRPEFESLDGYDAACRLDRLLQAHMAEFDDPWCELLPDHDTFDHEIHPRDSVIDRWDEVPTPIDPLSAGLVRASELAERFPICSARYTHSLDRPYLRVVSLAFWLARLSKGQAFFLGCRDAGEFAGCSHMTASQHLKRAQKDGLLELTKKSRSLDKAHEYAFSTARLWELGGRRREM